MSSIVLAGLMALAGPSCLAADSPLRLADQRELFVDDAVIERLSGTEVRLATPVPAGIVLTFDEPWEGRYSAFVTVLRDGAKYRLYYRGLGNSGPNHELTCYAESADGIRWHKPRLGLVELNGTRENGVILGHTPKRYAHNFCPMLDDRPGVPPGERFKAIGGGMTTSAESKATGAVRGLYRFVSGDGIHWRELPDRPLFTGYALDTQNVLVWLPAEQCYAIYLRMWSNDVPPKVSWKGVRLIARATSKDFVTWTTPEIMSTGGEAAENLYTNATHPYFRAPHLLIALPFRFAEERRLLPDDELRAAGIDASMWKGVSDGVLMTSRGGTRYDRKFMESFIRPGLDRGNWAARSNIPALGVVQTGPAEMSLYVTCGYGSNHPRLERKTLRLDGFASLHAGYQAGSAVTRPLVLEGTTLVVNYSTSSVGYVRVMVLDAAGREIPGFGEADAEELGGDEIDRPLRWRSGQTIDAVADRPVRLKFILRDADLYSFGVFRRPPDRPR